MNPHRHEATAMAVQAQVPERPAPSPAEPQGPHAVRTPEPPRRRRGKALLAGALVIAVLGAGWGVHAMLTAGQETTDDAQVEADLVPIAPRVGGQVVRVAIRDNQRVHKGDLVAQIDPADYSARVDQAEADLATARAQAAAAGAGISDADASIRRTVAEAEKATLDLARAEKLRAGDAIPPERLEAARAASQTSSAAVSGARAKVGSARAQADLAHARVKSAGAALDLARLQLAYTRVLAPADGVVSKLAVHEGQLIAAGQPMAELVPDESYVIANFKETQMGGMRPGQRAVVEIDAYPGRRLEGRVESISGGTGARFSLLPPDNASGNFVKVVERVPVRIAWAKPTTDLPMRAGLSATVTVHEK